MKFRVLLGLYLCRDLPLPLDRRKTTMPANESATPGAPCWIDLFTSDIDKSERFYGELFGWSAEHMGEESGNYVNFSKSGQPVAGAMSNDGSSGMFDLWTVYLTTRDLAATAESVTKHGGQVVVPPMQVMDEGSMAVFADSGQQGIAGWQPGNHTGFRVLNEPGAPCWFELHTRDYAGSVAFYRDVFGWDTHVASDTEDFRYTTLGQGEDQKAGVMDVSTFPEKEFPVGWSIYFGSADADATAAKAIELGGSLVGTVDDSPFGRLARLVDPTGARFKIVEVPAADPA